MWASLREARMDIIQIFQSFQTQEQAIEYLEQARWHGQPRCPYCKLDTVCRHASGDRAGQRWQCWSCKRAFSVTVGTIFHGTHVPLKNWFLLLGLMLNAKKSASAYQIARDLGMRRPTVWAMMHRVRVAMANDQEQAELLYGIVEADETYIGGKPRKGNRHDNDASNKRGRGTSKTPVVGLMERGGRVIARPAKPKELSSEGLHKFIRRFVDTASTLLVTDEFGGYHKVSEMMLHATVNHAVEYANGPIHTNNIENFWSLVKRAWYGSHHFYSQKYMNLYISEACYKFNQRKASNQFERLVGIMVAAA
jgi:transposase-like protein